MKRLRKRLKEEVLKTESKWVHDRGEVKGLNRALELVTSYSLWKSFKDVLPLNGEVVVVHSNSGAYKVLKYNIKLDIEKVCDFWMSVPKAPSDK